MSTASRVRELDVTNDAEFGETCKCGAGAFSLLQNVKRPREGEKERALFIWVTYEPQW